MLAILPNRSTFFNANYYNFFGVGHNLVSFLLSVTNSTHLYWQKAILKNECNKCQSNIVDNDIPNYLYSKPNNTPLSIFI